MASITQDIRYRLGLIRYAEKYGVTKAVIKYKSNQQYIYRGSYVLTTLWNPCEIADGYG